MLGWTDTPTDILPEGSASCVQNFDDSLDFAIRMTYRISLRSSSLWEPRHPLLKVLVTFFFIWGVLIPVWWVRNQLCFNHTLQVVGKKVWGQNKQNNTKKYFIFWIASVILQILKFTERKRKPVFNADFQLFLKGVVMILPQVHLRKPCYDFTFL